VATTWRYAATAAVALTGGRRRSATAAHGGDGPMGTVGELKAAPGRSSGQGVALGRRSGPVRKGKEVADDLTWRS
jgi:hypothetical protein